MGGSLTFDEITTLFSATPQVIRNLKYFVETGTYKAETTMAMAKQFQKVFTCEINFDNYDLSVRKAYSHGFKNIEFYLGDSLECLKSIMPKVDDWAVFFLDAHISGSDSSWNGKQYVPLMEELDIILSHMGKNPSLYIIDDCRFFDSTIKPQPHDWAHISVEKIKELFNKYGSEPVMFISNDRLWILTGN